VASASLVAAKSYCCSFSSASSLSTNFAQSWYTFIYSVNGYECRSAIYTAI